jgi:hypothetical protein
MGTLSHSSCLGRRHHRAGCTESANAHFIPPGNRERAESVSYLKSIQYESGTVYLSAVDRNDHLRA